MAARASATTAKRPRKPSKANAATAKRTAKRSGSTDATNGPVTELPKAAKPRAASPRRSVISIDDPAPRQGFECETEATGGSLHPPGGAELVASAAEIVGELAKVGFTTGERLFKDVLARLPLS